MLVDDRPVQKTEARAQLSHALLGRRPGRAKSDHVAADRRRSGAGAGHDRTVPVPVDDRLTQRRATDDARQSQLVAAGHEDASRLVQEIAEARVIGLLAAERPDPAHVPDAHGVEEGAVQLRRLVAQRAGRADDHDPSVVASGKVDEARQNLPLAELVLRPTNDQQVAGSGRRRAWRLDHARQHNGLGNEQGGG